LRFKVRPFRLFVRIPDVPQWIPITKAEQRLRNRSMHESVQNESQFSECPASSPRDQWAKTVASPGAEACWYSCCDGSVQTVAARDVAGWAKGVIWFCLRY